MFGFTYVKALVLIILLWHAQEFLFQVKKIEKCNLNIISQKNSLLLAYYL